MALPCVARAASGVFWRHLRRIGWCWLLALFTCLAQAGEWPVGPLDQHLELDERQLELLTDVSGHMGLAEVQAAETFVPATRGALSPGYSKAVFWLRGSLRNTSEKPLERWLEIGSPRTEEVSVYVFRASGEAVAEFHSGVKFGYDSRPLQADKFVFPLTLPPGEAVSFYVSMRGRTAVLISAELWEPLHFRSTEGNDHQWIMLLHGSMLTVVFYSLLQALIRRDRVLLVYAFWVFFSAAYEFTFQGYAFRYLWPDWPEWAVRATACFGTASQMALLGLSRHFFNPHQRLPWIERSLTFFTVLLGLGCFANAFLDFARVGPWLTLLSLIVNALWPVLLLFVWKRRAPFVGGLLWTSIFIWVVVNARTLYLLGSGYGHWLNTDGLLWVHYLGIVATLVVAGLSRSLALLKEKERLTDALFQERNQREAALEAAVEERTGELQRALQRADEANQAKSHFLARVSHDLRTPLTAVIGYADLIASAHRQDAGYGRVIRRSAGHLLELIDDLIDYARGREAEGTINPAPTYVYGLFTELGANGQALADRRHNRFVLDLAADLPPVVELDAKRVRQIVNNLLGNSAKFTEGGEICLAVFVLERSADHVRLCLEVRDDGIGIAPEDQQRVFSLFEQVSPRDKGLGIGLAVSLQLVERMGGTISLGSALGQGTTVRVELPLPLAAEAAVDGLRLPEKYDAGQDWRGNGHLIWVVEDHRDIRELLRVTLESQGFSVETISDGGEAVARLHALAEARESPGAVCPALVLTDQWMPGADGMAVLQAARRVLPTLPVVLLSATPSAEDCADGARFAATLLKPVSLSELMNTLGGCLNLLPEAREAEEGGLVGIGMGDQRVRQVRQVQLPSPEKLAELRALLALGAVSDMSDWAAALEAESPQFAALAGLVREVAQSLDWQELEALLEQAGMPIQAG